MGIGVGCGVGWGPGFGPEVIGYVGAGCGVGFSVGLTLAGVGVGLPANALIEVPYNVTSRSAENALRFARSITARNIFEERWDCVVPQISVLTKTAHDRLSCFNVKLPLSEGFDLTELSKSVSCRAQSTLECLDAFINRHLAPGRGSSQSSRGTKG
ncbi:unnamed protein product [Spirodela intermedia]|uniref:Uncharacterized protein n=1 Tax=Spirodela intermedia TaxID=51605 RepID=A0A7I8JJY8_SPIIN|nr:unnamed protein product [Spirodela intermedia]CAA6669913.1 unnamed protein product [Spirodela intermedia]